MPDTSVREQLLAAFEASGLKLAELRKLAGLDMDETSLGRKLRGFQSLRTEEADRIAAALNRTFRLVHVEVEAAA